MRSFEISGVIVSNDDAELYDWFGIENTSPKMLKDFLSESGGDDVIITINSGGGDLYSGVNMHDTLKAYSGDVEIHICGLAASAASIIAMAGRCLMSPGSNIMIHNAACTDCSNKNGKVKIAKDLAVTDRGIAAVYEAKSGKSSDEILKLMDRETWLDAKNALEMGLIDGILGSGGAGNMPDTQITNSAANILPRSVLDKARVMLANERSKRKTGMKIDSLYYRLELLRR